MVALGSVKDGGVYIFYPRIVLFMGRSLLAELGSFVCNTECCFERAANGN